MNREKFKVYREVVKIKTRKGEEEFELLPLSGRYLPKLMRVVKELSKNSDNEEGLVEEMFSEQTINDVHELLMETFKFSYKIDDERDVEELDLFVTQNLFNLIPGLVAVNMGKQSEAKPVEDKPVRTVNGEPLIKG